MAGGFAVSASSCIGEEFLEKIMANPSEGMRFTDESRDRLKELNVYWIDSEAKYVAVSPFELKALLARLSASEQINKSRDAYDDFDCPHVSEDRCKCGTVQMKLLKEVHDAEEVWRKIAGK